MRVDKILRELGYPEPPLNLDIVRALLALDRSYFSSETNGLLARTVSRLKRGGKQPLAARRRRDGVEFRARWNVSRVMACTVRLFCLLTRETNCAGSSLMCP